MHQQYHVQLVESSKFKGPATDEPRDICAHMKKYVQLNVVLAIRTTKYHQVVTEAKAVNWWPVTKYLGIHVVVHISIWMCGIRV